MSILLLIFLILERNGIMAEKMGLRFGLEGVGQYCKRQFRWIFEIEDVCGVGEISTNALPPEKGARPNISFKEMEAKHLIEDVFYPAKPEWKPINITLFDLDKQKHPVYEWLKECYDPEKGKFKAPKDGKLIKDCTLKMLDGCGNIIETWIFEDAWPQAVNFMNLDMTSNQIVMCEITLRYVRAYVQG